MFILEHAVRHGGKDGVKTYQAGEHEALPEDLVKELGLKEIQSQSPIDEKAKADAEAKAKADAKTAAKK